MGLDPKKEQVEDIFPHVAAVAAAYGDPTGKYRAFLLSHDQSYKTRDYWFYDQPSAFFHSPGAGRSKKEYKRLKRNDPAAADYVQDGQEIFATHTVQENSTSSGQVTTDLDHLDGTNPDVPTIPFECPNVFEAATTVQLDDGVYVTCDQLKPFYGYLS